ncbi:MAG TPA: ATP-binding cassette domain-containing protein [Flavobacteriia bacterium]|jgi:ABC-2 type transport system ATP-binding protein|nr:ATP-binding cassette domain-containing protein [Flavobacteriia bacterium]
MSLEVKNISKFYGAQKALDRVNFSLNSGEIVGFLGPNGAGKSTTMKIITTYLKPDHGEVLVHGLKVSTNSYEVKKIIGYLPEHNPLYLEMFVKEYLEFCAGIHRIDKSRIKEIIDLVELQTESHKKIKELSKGYRQRVGLAAALLHDPEVLILDEPTTGLDPNQLVGIRALIKEIGKTKTVLLSTHIMQEVEAICDRVIIINKGKIVADDTLDNLTHQKSLTAVFSDLTY